MMVSAFHPFGVASRRRYPLLIQGLRNAVAAHPVHGEREDPTHDRSLALIDLAVGKSAIAPHVLVSVAPAPVAAPALKRWSKPSCTRWRIFSRSTSAPKFL